MDIKKSYIESVKNIYETLSIDELLHEYFDEKLNPVITEEARLVIQEIFLKNNISIADAFWRHQTLLKAGKYLIEDKKLFPSPKVIGERWFYDDWLKSMEIAEQVGDNSKNIETIDSYYKWRSAPLTLEQQEAVDKSIDEIETMIHYGKYKTKK